MPTLIHIPDGVSFAPDMVAAVQPNRLDLDALVAGVRTRIYLRQAEGRALRLDTTCETDAIRAAIAAHAEAAP